MNGDLSTEGDLSVGEHGRVKGNVSGRNVVVGGMIQGNVNTTGRLEILATGKVIPDVAEDFAVGQDLAAARGVHAALDHPADNDIAAAYVALDPAVVTCGQVTLGCIT